METKHSYTSEFVTSTHIMDFQSALRPSGLMEIMQETAGGNSDALGCGRADLLKKNMVWVLLRCQIFMDRWPTMGQTASVLTYPKQPRHGMYPRYFVVRDEQGQEIGKAFSLWTLLDIESRKSVQSPEVASSIPDNSELKPCLPGMPPMVTPLDTEPVVGLREPVYSDLDANCHVNNVRYLDWCCDALGIDVLRDMELANFAVCFLQEIVPGQKIRTELRRKDNLFSFSGTEGATRHFEISGELRPR